jgi:5'-methylthioadenosine phosphorylase
MAKIGIIGGSGLYDLEGLTNVREVVVETPFGSPSDAIVCGDLDGVSLAFLPRHGRGHVLNPSEIPFRANIFALKSLGVEWIMSMSAVGSLRDEIVPGNVVLIDQFIDRTKSRPATFFDEGIVAHVGFGHPVCETMRTYLLEASREVGAIAHDGGTYVCMEGPAFSTVAESNLYRSWGASVVGMTNLTEAKLAREAEISYATVAFSTDYDCWHPDHDAVTVDAIIAVLMKNVQLSKEIIKAAVKKVAAHEGPAPCHDALATAILTQKDAISPKRRKELDILVHKYL